MMKSSPVWTPTFIERSPIFAPFREFACDFGTADWPSIDGYQRFADRHAIVNARGKPLRLVDANACSVALGYEQRIDQEAVLPMRRDNWHDFFNLLVWARFPKTKATLNRRHGEAYDSGAARRGALRDAITLFDESGAIIACAHEGLFDALHGHAWQTLFWDQRERWGREIECVVFGHAVYEKALNPYIGLTAKALCIAVTPSYFLMESTERVLFLDQAAAARWDAARSAMTALPVLGVPGWWPENDSKAFYANQRYFRPR